MIPVPILAGLLFATAIGCAALAILMPGKPRLATHRRRPDQPLEQGLFTGAGDAVAKVLNRRGTKFPLLELAAVKLSPQDLVVRSIMAAFIVFALGFVLVAPWLGLLLALVTPLFVWVWLLSRRDARRKQFGEQLDDTLQMLAGSMRAGHSMAAGLAFVAAEAPEPMAAELGRVINQSRMGRDLTAALSETHVRMDNEDFGWVVQAIAINREVGGNLAEVLDAVSKTIRQRDGLRRQVQALSSEGKMSALILMGLPVVVIVLLSVINPSYLAVLVTTFLGWVFIVASVILFVIGGFWMRAVTRIKF
ncbi:type II secretion system F family protein [Tessaracoccus sp. SD287]|uniref:type II secretion system F family protein n=1 Tax=Tessaracoccus sp. SD287 TaxID=2782008 RepID=UPI001A958F10|nr:type II secretion system F family protein [Tessaracoccus sp. SD287]MBO1031721.1 type II secretion system F family protein [Tessaracoccus sp. SD287]